MNTEAKKAGTNPAKIRELFGYSSNLAYNWFAVSNSPGALACWILPLADHYAKLQQTFPGHFLRPYESLRQQYESLRRPFTVTADVPYTDVWQFPTVQSYQGKHPCEKPAALMEHIILASSRPDAVVLDCFAGSGATLAAAKKHGRAWLGMEIDPHWVDVARGRLGQDQSFVSAAQRQAWLEAQQPKPVAVSSDKVQLDIFNIKTGAA